MRTGDAPRHAGRPTSDRRALRSAASGRLVAALLALQLLLAGCASPVAPVLLALPAGDAAAGAAGAVGTTRQGGAAPTLLVRRVAVPEYMASKRVRYWQSAGVLAEWPDTWWAERIEVALTREFAAALRRELPGWTVCEAACGDLAAAMTVKLELQRLDYVRSERRLTAVAQTWVGRLPAGAAPAAATALEQQLDLPVSPDTAPAQATALTRLLRTLAAPVAALARAQSGAPGSAETAR